VYITPQGHRTAEITMTVLRIALTAGTGAIAGLLGYGLAPSNPAAWGVGAMVLAIVVVIAFNALTVRDEDRDPTIRPPNRPYEDERRKR
jgi:hypothetical protein